MEHEQTDEDAGESPAEQQMTTLSHHRFGNSSDTADTSFSISIIEVPKLIRVLDER